MGNWGEDPGEKRNSFSRYKNLNRIRTSMEVRVLLIGLLGALVTLCSGEVLTPPYFNLAQGRLITASATCGEGMVEPELYCKLVGANADTDVNINVIQGQVCDFCEANVEGRMHPAEFAIDGSERWWQSPPLSRGMKFNEVNLTIELGQEFHVAYVLITMANSPRPAVWVLERSNDEGKTYKPWQYFADTPTDCKKIFGVSDQRIIADDTVICDSSYSKVVPLEGGEIFLSLLNNRPSAGDFFSSDTLQEWTTATHIRLRFLRTKTLLGHLMSVARQDPTVTRRYFYSIKDISIGGRCRCNGHAGLCDIAHPDYPYRLLCRCEHNTCGSQCEICCPGFVQKAWRPSTFTAPFQCEPCNCHGHSQECYYDPEVEANSTSLDKDGNYEGGGVCINCKDHTKGINCHECEDTYFRPADKNLGDPDVCQPCLCDDYYSTGNCEDGTGECECKAQFLPPDCDQCNYGYYDYPECKPCDCHFNGTRGALCEVGGGQCPCKQNYSGKNCDECAEGFYDFPECLECNCHDLGAVSPVCDPLDGQCECGNNYGSRSCGECEDGYFDFPTCTYCSCDVRGTRKGICEKENGNCLCKEGYGGTRCDQCVPGYYGYPDCRPCNCSSVGSASSNCDTTGKCPCLPNFAGRACNRCNPGYFSYPECLSCNCHSEGSMGVSCDDEGKCQCKANFAALRCDECRAGFYNFPACEECNCDPAGVLETFRGCGDSPPGELCQCKPRVTGRICNKCKPLYWNLQEYNPLGCQDCDCNTPGVIGGVQVCDGESGQCPCKPHVTSRKCELCTNGYFNITASSVLGCTDCACDVGGAENNICNKITGQCPCRPRVTGKTCTGPATAHYYPTLYQFKYEAEDGSTPSGGTVRFGYDEDMFPGYSWRGYAVYSQLQPITNHTVDIDKSSLYRTVVRYKNPGEQPVSGMIVATPDNTLDQEQSYKVKFEPGEGLYTVSSANIPSPFVLNPGRWNFSIHSDQYLLIDYFVLLPAEYYEASLLQKNVLTPCLVNITRRSNVIYPNPCLKLNYPNVKDFDGVMGTNGYLENGDAPDQIYSNEKVLEALEAEKMVMMSPIHKKLNYELPIRKGGRYALILEYFTPYGSNLTKLIVDAKSAKGDVTGEAKIYDCRLATPCRSVVVDENGKVSVFRFGKGSVDIALSIFEDHLDKIGVHKITAVPLGKWSLDYITPRRYCTMKDGECENTGFLYPPDSTKAEAENAYPERLVEAEDMPPGVSDAGLVLLDNANRTLDLDSFVQTPGYYNILIHYYQPDNPDFNMEVLIENGQHYMGQAPMVHCPGISGCRAEVSQADEESGFFIEDEFKVILKSPKKVWIDNVLAVPTLYKETRELAKYLEPKPLDESRKFINECGGKNFYIDSSENQTSEFCRKSTFSITSNYNNGAFPCQCDFSGSLSFTCEKFGGQCECKENVIGRRCEKCKTGHFGFPNCQPCDCPSTAVCDEGTGECQCPPRVRGEKCDTCAELTYGFDHLIGCVECGCSTLGTFNGNLQCDLKNGSCDCKPHVVGRTCDECQAGYWAFPYCQQCRCDMRGTVPEICDQETAVCKCKANVEGSGCDQCSEGSFNIQESNPMGCTDCFCFGKTSRCSSSDLIMSKITPQNKIFSAVVLNPMESPSFPQIPVDVVMESENYEYIEDSNSFSPMFVPGVLDDNETSCTYFKVMLQGTFLNSYGGKLEYVLTSKAEDDATRMSFGAPDVIIEGNDVPPSKNVIRLLYYGVSDLNGEDKMIMELPLLAENFVYHSPTTGGLVPATREMIMVILSNLTAIYVRGSYWEKSWEPILESFSLEMGLEGYEGGYAPVEVLALTVEQCHCPPNYEGLSCEKCAPGYYRSPTGPFGGFCVPCQCNGHSTTCDPSSGICLDCQHNTIGNHCEMCAEGYHGDATGGTRNDCLICACPLPLESNNFATSCELSPDGLQISCQCKEPYIGPRCEGCGPGFFGNPELPGSSCQPCDCSGNIDTSDPQSCDTVTGACLKCLNNTGGPACNLCASGFYGDAVLSKDCKQCSCNECGTKECDHKFGECICLPNVEGLDCDSCAPDHYGLSRCDGTGCHPCDCDIASLSSQCEDKNGQCPCKRGTTGLRCEECAPGFWNYTVDGCLACQCNQEYAIGVGCDPATGQCSCLPGVIGEKCDRCPYRWVLVEDRGCMECDTCHHQLLDGTDEMAAALDPVKDEFDSVAVSYFTTQKLVYFNDTAAELEPDVQLMDPSRVDLYPFYEAMSFIESDANNHRQQAELISDSLKKKKEQSGKLKDASIEIESKVQEAVAKSTTAVFETKDLMEGLLAKETPTTTPQLGSARAEAEAILETMKKASFDDILANAEKSDAVVVLSEIKEFVKPISNVSRSIDKESGKIDKIKDKLKDLSNQSDYSMETSLNAIKIMEDQTNDDSFNNKYRLLESITGDMIEKEKNTTDLNEVIPELTSELDNAFMSLGPLLDSVQSMKAPLKENMENLKDELDNNKDTISVSRDHAEKLKREADRLENMLQDTRAVSENAVVAATSYQSIAEALEKAQSLAENAKEKAENASQVAVGIREEALAATEPSRNLLVMADESLNSVEVGLKIPLRDAKRSIERIDALNAATTDALDEIDEKLDASIPTEYEQDIREANIKSEDAIQKASQAQRDVEDILEGLPKESSNARKLRLTVTDLNKGVEISDNQLSQAKESIPLSDAIIGNLESKQPMIDESKDQIGDKLNELKGLIASAREQASRIPVGVNLQDSSFLELENPHTLDHVERETDISFYFKTQEPDGLLLYLGNEPGGKKEDDYLSVEVDRGYPVLTMDLGSGPRKIVNEKFVADDRWYHALISRQGKAVKFIVEEEDQFGNKRETVKEDYLPGSKSLLNVDRNNSKLYVGGVPPGQYNIPVSSTTYRGNVEDLKIGGQKVGLWNFKTSENLQPAYKRDRFVDLRPETGLRFQGNGYALLESRQYPLREQSDITFKFKTRARTGLMFLAGKGKKFMSIEMRNGAIVFQYNLGDGTATVVSRYDHYNDGEWHRVEAIRQGPRSVLRLDGRRDEEQGSSPGSARTLMVSDYVYFGGYPGSHDYNEVTNKDFEGCLEEVLIERRPVDLTQAVESRYTLVGCPSSYFAPSIASFGGKGYIRLDPMTNDVNIQDGSEIVDDEDVFELNFKLRSNESDGLLFYGASPDQKEYLSVSMADGLLHVKSGPEDTHIRTDEINDGNWHVVTITKDQNGLKLNVDDLLDIGEPTDKTRLTLSQPGSVIFFGGKPEEYELAPAASESESSYKGCLGEININGKRVDFTNAASKDSALDTKCLNEDEIVATQKPDDFSRNQEHLIPKGEDELKPTEKDEEVMEEKIEKGEEEPVEEEDATMEKPKPTDMEEVEKPKYEPRPSTPPPEPFERCALPYRYLPPSAHESEISLDRGVRFGNFEKTSRMEFFQAKDDGSRSEYSIEFKTAEPNGLIFMWTEFEKIDFMALFISRGILFFAFDSGSGPAFLNSSQTFNDSKWHSVTITRYLTTGSLIVDGDMIASGNSSGGTSNINAGEVVYIGGLPEEGWSKISTSRKLQYTRSPFRGCIRAFKIRNQTPNPPLLVHSVEPCTDSVERGWFFYPGAGYLKLHNRFVVGRNIKMSMKIKPRHPSGILVAVHGNRDFMVLQMINGTIRFTVDNGKGPLYSSFTKQPYDICDGQWHTIRVSKSKNVVTLALDGTYSSPGIGAAGKDTTNTKHPLYVGGHPDPTSVAGLLTTEQYVGCIKDLSIEGSNKLRFTHDKIVGNVAIHSCPSN